MVGLPQMIGMNSAPHGSSGTRSLTSANAFQDLSVFIVVRPVTALGYDGWIV